MLQGLKVLNLAQNKLTRVPAWIYSQAIIETVDLSKNQITAWSDESIDFSRCTIRHLDISLNPELSNPPTNLLQLSVINKLNLVGCNVEKANLINNMDTNGVKEYQERHKRKLDQAVNNNLAVDYKLFGL